jgi:hypothetical protein
MYETPTDDSMSHETALQFELLEKTKLSSSIFNRLGKISKISGNDHKLLVNNYVL